MPEPLKVQRDGTLACAECNGSGRFYSMSHYSSSGPVEHDEPCEFCNDGTMTCCICGKDARVQSDRQVYCSDACRFEDSTEAVSTVIHAAATFILVGILVSL